MSEIKVGQKYKYLGMDDSDPDEGALVTVVSVDSLYIAYEPGLYGATGTWPGEDFTADFALLEEEKPVNEVVEESQKFDPVAKPEHYNHGKYEVIDVIEDWGLDEDYYLGNAFKYIARHRHKGNARQDIEKAVWYLQRWLGQN